MTALNEYNGATLWSIPTPSPWSINPATYDNGQVFLETITGNEVGQLWSLNPATGATTWVSPLVVNGTASTPPTIANGAIYCRRRRVRRPVRLQRVDGASLFTAGTAQYDQWTPAYYNGKVYTWIGGTFAEDNAATGATDWSLSLRLELERLFDEHRPGRRNNDAFVVGTTGLFAVNLTTDAASWSIADTGFSGSPAVAGNIVYAIHGTQVNAYDVTTGRSRALSTPAKRLSGNRSSPRTG